MEAVYPSNRVSEVWLCEAAPDASEEASNSSLQGSSRPFSGGEPPTKHQDNTFKTPKNIKAFGHSSGNLDIGPNDEPVKAVKEFPIPRTSINLNAFSDSPSTIDDSSRTSQLSLLHYIRSYC
jgi:hypothetical protein